MLPETPEGRLARELMGDTVEFAHEPTVYKISDKDFLSRTLAVPIRFTQLTRIYNFYWVYFPIILFPKRGWGFKGLEVGIEFEADKPDAHIQPKVHHILPEKKFQTILEIKGHIELRLDENLQFELQDQMLEANIGLASGKLEGRVNAKVAGGLGTVLGPFIYSMKRAKIDHTTPEVKKVFWRINGKEFFQDDDVPLIVIVKVPKEAKAVKVAAAMHAYRSFSYANAGFQEAVLQLPSRLRDFFHSGLPVEKRTSWDITPWL